MSHAEAVHTLQPAAGATDQIVQFTTGVRYDALPEDARHYARRHLLDTVGVMIAGAGGTIATQAETVIKAVRPDGKIPVAGRARRERPVTGTVPAGRTSFSTFSACVAMLPPAPAIITPTVSSRWRLA